MNPVIAQLVPSMVNGLPAWLVSAGALLWIYNETRKAFKRREPKPANEQLEITQVELRRRVTDLEKNMMAREWFTKIEADIETIRREAKTDLANQTERLEDKIDNNYAELTEKLRTLPNEIVVILKNTGAI